MGKANVTEDFKRDAVLRRRFIRIVGSKTELVRMLIADQTRQLSVPRGGVKWRAAPDEDEHYEIVLAL